MNGDPKDRKFLRERLFGERKVGAPAEGLELTYIQVILISYCEI
jgi:hypothetical protein